MPRKRVVTKREAASDPKYRSHLVAYFTHCLMKKGKKSTAQSVLYGAFNIIEEKIKEFDGIIIEDYNKGLLKKEIIHRTISLANSNDIPINIDPKFDNFFEYKKATVFKPNMREIETKLGIRFTDDNKLMYAGEKLLNKLECRNILITRGEKGMTLFKDSGEIVNVGTRAKEIHDVSGAGDTVIATLTAVMVAGGDVEEATTIANYAAGVVCGEVGVVPIKIDQLKGAFTEK